MKYPGKEASFFNEVEWFDSFSQAMEVCKTRRHHDWMFGAWAGGIRDWDHADRMNRTGDVEAAKALTAAYDAAAMANITAVGEAMQLDFAGYLPCIPSYLAGEPMHMRRNVPCETSKAPITIVIDLTSAGGISAQTLQKRATRIACLILYLSVFRAVSVYTITTCMDTHDKGGYYIPAVKIGTTPMDLPQLAWQVCNPFAARGVAYGLGNFTSGSIAWACFKDPATGRSQRVMNMASDVFAEHIKRILGLNPEDIVFPPVFFEDRDKDNPEVWAKKRMTEMGYKID